ncbi:MAG: 3-deoxy-7-phosphoheptulonate synthase [Rickettsiales bacterium]
MICYNNYIQYTNNLGEIEKSREEFCRDKEIQSLKDYLRDIEQNKGFVLNAGPCSEELNYKKSLSLLSSLSEACQVLKKKYKNPALVPRVFGQTFKLRTNIFDIRNNHILPNFFGEAVNNVGYDEFNREINGNKLIQNYDHIRRCYQSYKTNNRLFFSHEICDARYEEKFLQNGFVANSHLLWLGYRAIYNTRIIKFLSSIKNPIAIKIGPNTDVQHIKALIQRINLENHKGKIVLIFRFGRKYVADLLPLFFEHLQSSDINFVAMCDPMHGNNQKNKLSKFRIFDDLIYEMEVFKKSCVENNVYFGGLNLEYSNQNIYECIYNIDDKQKYLTNCDPCLNKSQLIKLINRLCDE